MSDKKQRIAFVVPRFGESIVGGAETLVGALARRVAMAGWEVSILTTCAKDNRTWENHFASGESTEYGLNVKRFPVNPRNLEVWIPHQIGISQGLALGIDDQLDWMQESVNSAELYDYIQRNQSNYDWFIFAPYLFGTTFWGSLINPRKSILLPCLHDEHYAYTDVMRSMFSQVAGCLFNANAEQELATMLYGSVAGGEVGMGFDMHTPEYTADLEPYFSDTTPYLLYVGRKETGKNVQLVIDYFTQLQEVSPLDLKLVIVGGGDFSDLSRDWALTRSDVIDLTNVSERDKHRLIKHAMTLVQPSVNESFSIVIMESWMLGTPVLVHSKCAVTREHVIESSGGLYFGSFEDFFGVINELTGNAELRQTLAQNGYNYVSAKYSWSAVTERFEQVLQKISEKDLIQPDSF